ncbi:MAG: HEPN domain-containing protein [Ardenticatenaceae bacterium]|nr:HEPN domain-containing protein [Ardenticatenaceae bacterium]
MRRHADWFRQAQRKLDSARWDIQGRFYEDACFSAQQAAELAAKALLERQGHIEMGHSVYHLLQAAGNVPQDVLDAGRVLDRYYFPTRYPNGFPAGAPMDFYDQPTAEGAVKHAERILEFVGTRL